MAERKKTTVYIDADLLTEAKVAAARSGKHEYEVFEEALRERLGFQQTLERIWAKTDAAGFTEDEALEFAVQEQKAARAERNASKAS